MDYLVEVADAAALRSLTPNITALVSLPVRGVIKLSVQGERILPCGQAVLVSHVELFL